MSGAGKESRTPDLNLGKVALYQLSYSRVGESRIIAEIRGRSKSAEALKLCLVRALDFDYHSITLAIASAT